MNGMRDAFSNMIAGGEVNGNSQMKLLSQLVQQYPYCQPAQFLYARALMAADPSGCKPQLNIALAIAPDRQHFRTFLAQKNRPLAKKRSKTLNQQEIIDRFISKQPHIRPRKEEVSSAEPGGKSLEDHPDIVSETLADLLLKQGNRDRAVAIYKKLSLNFPEKSTYFAKKISAAKGEKNKSS